MKWQLSCAAILACAVNTQAATIVDNTTVEFQSEPVGIKTCTPRFSWTLQSDKRDVTQQAYQIEISSSADGLGRANIWSSGKIRSDQSHLVTSPGSNLQPSSIYYWRVCVWTSTGETCISEPARMITARDANIKWDGSWIGLNDQANIKIKDTRTVLPARYVRKGFTLSATPVKALLSVSGIGSSTCYINGQRISDDIFGPLPTWYDSSVFYITYDVSSMVSSGDNAIGIILGNGRYFPMRKDWSIGWDVPRLMAELEVTYTDGHVEKIVTDPSWRATSNGPIRANNEYDGEIYDATMELGAWTTVDYDDRNWSQAVILDAPSGTLKPQMSPSLVVAEHLHPISIRKVGDNRYIVDMGQNMVGVERVKLSATKGEPVTMRFAEVLQSNDDTQLYVDNLRTAKVEDTYIPSKTGEFVWQPEFTYHGYRFMEITGVSSEPTIDDIEGLVVYDKMSTIGSFKCSNNVLTDLHRNAYWGIRGNYRGMPTDCPQRDERQGWLGDRATGAYGESFIFDNALLYRKWMADIEESMKEDGTISDVSPRYWSLFNDNVTWPSAFFYISDMLYHQFGDDYSILNRYKSMRKWVTHITNNCMTDYIVTVDNYGDWCLPPESLELIHSKDPTRITDGKLLSTAVFYDILRLMKSFAIMNGYPDDYNEYAALAEKVKQSYNATFYHPDTHSYSNNTVTANIISLHLGLVPEGDEQAVCDNAAKRTIEECNGHVSVGVLGIQHLMRCLTEYGYIDLAYRIATNHTYPSWGYMIDHGATTIWELWNGDTADPAMNSRNHVMLLGDVIVWLYENLAGIKNAPDSIGFKKIIMSPSFPTGLDYVDAIHMTPYGKVSSRWNHNGDTIEWIVNIPVNTSAILQVPKMFNLKLHGDQSGLHYETIADDIWTAEVGSGTYTFTSTK